MTDFSTAGEITIQPEDQMTYYFKFTNASSQHANDGSLPYGVSISSVTVTAFDSDGTNVTSLLIMGTPTVADNIVTVKLQYPGYEDQFKLTFYCTLSNGDKKEFDFSRVFSEDK